MLNNHFHLFYFLMVAVVLTCLQQRISFVFGIGFNVVFLICNPFPLFLSFTNSRFRLISFLFKFVKDIDAFYYLLIFRSGLLYLAIRRIRLVELFWFIFDCCSMYYWSSSLFSLFTFLIDLLLIIKRLTWAGVYTKDAKEILLGMGARKLVSSLGWFFPLLLQNCTICINVTH